MKMMMTMLMMMTTVGPQEAMDNYRIYMTIARDLELHTPKAHLLGHLLLRIPGGTSDCRLYPELIGGGKQKRNCPSEK